jgi:hypothetical protein
VKLRRRQCGSSSRGNSLDGERDELTSRDETPHASSRGMDVEDAEAAEAALDPRIQVLDSQMILFRLAIPDGCSRSSRLGLPRV